MLRKTKSFEKNTSFDECVKLFFLYYFSENKSQLLQSYDDFDHFFENVNIEKDKNYIDPHLLHKIYLQISSTRLLVGNKFKVIMFTLYYKTKNCNSGNPKLLSGAKKIQRGNFEARLFNT